MRLSLTEKIILITFTVCVFLVKGYLLYNSDNADIIPIYEHMANPQSYSGEFYMDEAVKPSSSRYFISLAVAGVMKTGLSIETILFGLYSMTFILGSVGFWMLAKTLSKQKTLLFYIITIAVYNLTEIAFRLGYAGFKFAMPLPSTFMAGLCIFAYGLYFSQTQANGLRKAAALFLCGIATLIQAFIGLFFGGVLLLFLFYEVLIKKSNVKNLIIDGLLFCIPVGIAILLGMTGSQNPLSSSEIVEILARYRQPHHNYPAAWMALAYIEFAIVIVSSLYMHKTLKYGKNQSQGEKMLTPLIYITAVVGAVSVLMNYISTSIYPLPFFSKLQSGRAFAPFIAAVCLVWSYKAVDLFRKRQIFWAVTLLGMLIVPFGGLLLLPYMLIESMLTQRTHNRKMLLKLCFGAILLGFVVFLGITEPTAQPTESYLGTLIVFVLFLIMTFLGEIPIGKSIESENNKEPNKARLTDPANVSVAENLDIRDLSLEQGKNITIKPVVWNGAGKAPVLIPAVCILIAIAALIVKGPAFLRPERPYPEMEKLAAEFDRLSKPDDIVLSDPFMEESLYFRFYASRGMVVSFKCIPHADDGIREWYSRMKDVGGINLERGKRTGIPLAKRHWNDVVLMAQKYHASFILARKEWYPDLEVKPLTEQGDWVIYKVE